MQQFYRAPMSESKTDLDATSQAKTDSDPKDDYRSIMEVMRKLPCFRREYLRAKCSGFRPGDKTLQGKDGATTVRVDVMLAVFISMVAAARRSFPAELALARQTEAQEREVPRALADAGPMDRHPGAGDGNAPDRLLSYATLDHWMHALLQGTEMLRASVEAADGVMGGGDCSKFRTQLAMIQASARASLDGVADSTAGHSGEHAGRSRGTASGIVDVVSGFAMACQRIEKSIVEGLNETLEKKNVASDMRRCLEADIGASEISSAEESTSEKSEVAKTRKRAKSYFGGCPSRPTAGQCIAVAFELFRIMPTHVVSQSEKISHLVSACASFLGVEGTVIDYTDHAARLAWGRSQVERQTEGSSSVTRAIDHASASLLAGYCKTYCNKAGSPTAPAPRDDTAPADDDTATAAAYPPPAVGAEPFPDGNASPTADPAGPDDNMNPSPGPIGAATKDVGAALADVEAAATPRGLPGATVGGGTGNWPRSIRHRRGTKRAPLRRPRRWKRTLRNGTKRD